MLLQQTKYSFAPALFHHDPLKHLSLKEMAWCGILRTAGPEGHVSSWPADSTGNERVHGMV